MSVDMEKPGALYLGVFEAPQNGTPEDISKSGCLALAQLGSKAWNAWRKDFPTVGGKLNHGYGVTSQYGNFADFRNHSFEEAIDFSNFDFGAHAQFENTEFKKTALFDQAKFGEDANFDLAKFQEKAVFQRARFEDGVSFKCAYFADLAFFRYALLGGKGAFTAARFCGQTDFSKVLFGSELVFDHAFFDCATVSFAAGNWEDFLAAYPPEGRLSIRHWAEEKNLQPGKMNCASFGGTTFKGDVDFSGIEFSGRTLFCQSSSSGQLTWPKRDDKGNLAPAGNGRVQMLASFECKLGIPLVFGSPPIFHNCKFNQDVSFDGAKFPKATGFEGSIRSYRTLKLASSQQQAVREEQLFFQLEMAEEAKHASWRQRGLYETYGFLSNFGFSLWRPLVLLLVTWMVFASLYGVLANLTFCLPFQNECHISSAWVAFSLLQALPLPGLDKLSEALRATLFGLSDPSISVTVSILFHKIMSLLALFLTGLALRNLFKMK